MALLWQNTRDTTSLETGERFDLVVPSLQLGGHRDQSWWTRRRAGGVEGGLLDRISAGDIGGTSARLLQVGYRWPGCGVVKRIHVD